MKAKPIIGYEGIYDITTDGKVYSRRIKKNMKTFINNSGYEVIDLTNKGKVKKHLVHRLVAHHFVQGYGEGKEVNHKDSNKLNNHYTNLEWVTRKENVRHSIEKGSFNVKKAQEVAQKKNRKPVAMVDSEGEILKIFDSAKEAEEKTGSKRSKISMVCNGHRKTTNGFSWKFI